MRFICARKDTGKIDAVREATGVRTPKDMLEHAYGPDAADYVAIPYAREFGKYPMGKRLDVATKKLVDDLSEPTWEARARASEATLNAARTEAAEKGVVLDSL